MTIAILESDGVVSFVFEGRLDAVSSESAEPMMRKAIRDKGRYLYDLSSLQYISSAGLRVLLATTRAIQSKDGRFVLCAPNENVRHILEISGFASLFPITASSAEGRRLLSR